VNIDGRPTKRWKHRGNPLRIYIQHEPGVQRGFMEGKKSRKKHPTDTPEKKKR
jgi:hypothetical protein